MSRDLFWLRSVDAADAIARLMTVPHDNLQSFRTLGETRRSRHT